MLLALAEEMFFRGFVAGLLFRRFGFRTGNIIQALIFLSPHLLLLLVSLRLWPLLPLQLIAGWVLGWLRQRSDSIGPGWLAHALTNLLPALLFGLLDTPAWTRRSPTWERPNPSCAKRPGVVG